jgi:hypothetical protein
MFGVVCGCGWPEALTSVKRPPYGAAWEPSEFDHQAVAYHCLGLCAYFVAWRSTVPSVQAPVLVTIQVLGYVWFLKLVCFTHQLLFVLWMLSISQNALTRSHTVHRVTSAEPIANPSLIAAHTVHGRLTSILGITFDTLACGFART